jgi:hypothetical protein
MFTVKWRYARPALKVREGIFVHDGINGKCVFRHTTQESCRQQDRVLKSLVDGANAQAKDIDGGILIFGFLQSSRDIQSKPRQRRRGVFINLFIYTAKRGCRRDGLRRMGKGIHTCCGSGEIEKAVGVGYEMRS